MKHRTATAAETIVFARTGEGQPTILLLHGNSGCKEAFEAQLEDLSDIGEVVAPDLLGHGESDNSSQPGRDYTLAGHATYLAELVAPAGNTPIVVVGTSLGGHIGLELAVRLPRLAGLLLVGAPPFAKHADSIGSAWQPGPAISLSGKADLSDEDLELFVASHKIGGTAMEARLRSAVRRTDGRSRTSVVAGLLTPEAEDQRELLARLSVPVAVVNGGDDDVVNLDFIEQAPYRSLWRGTPVRIAGAGHMPQVSHPAEFNAILRAFVSDCATGH